MFVLRGSQIILVGRNGPGIAMDAIDDFYLLVVSERGFLDSIFLNLFHEVGWQGWFLWNRSRGIRSEVWRGTVIDSSFGIQELVIINDRVALVANSAIAGMMSDGIFESSIF